MGKIKFNESSVPSTLEEGAFVVVDGVVYAGNSSEAPVKISTKRIIGEIQANSSDISWVERFNNTGITITESKDSTGQYSLSGDSDFSTSADKMFVTLTPEIQAGSVPILLAANPTVSEISIRLYDATDNSLSDPAGATFRFNVKIEIF